jgi:hypothetical protein
VEKVQKKLRDVVGSVVAFPLVSAVVLPPVVIERQNPSVKNEKNP